MNLAENPAFLAPSILFFALGSIFLLTIACFLGSATMQNNPAVPVIIIFLFLLVSAFWYFMSTYKITDDKARLGMLIEYGITKGIAFFAILVAIFKWPDLLANQTFYSIVVVLRIVGFLVEAIVSYVYRKKTTSAVDFTQVKIILFVVFSILAFGSGIGCVFIDDNTSPFKILCNVLLVIFALCATITIYMADFKGSSGVGTIALMAVIFGVLDIILTYYLEPSDDEGESAEAEAPAVQVGLLVNEGSPRVLPFIPKLKNFFAKASSLFLVFSVLQLCASDRQEMDTGEEEVVVATAPFTPIVPQKPAANESVVITVNKVEQKPLSSAPSTSGPSSTSAPTTFPAVASVDLQTIVSLLSASTKGTSSNTITNTSYPSKIVALDTPVSIVDNDDFKFLDNAYADRPASLAKSDYLPVNSAVVSTPCIVALMGETLDWFKKYTLNSCLDGYPFCLAPNEDGTCIVPTINVNINNQNKAYLNGMVAGFFKTLFPDIPVAISPYQNSTDNNKWTTGYNAVVKNTSLASQQIYKPISVRGPTAGLAGPAVVSASSSQNLFVSNESKLLSSLSFKIDKSRLSEGSGDPKKAFHVKLTDATGSSITIFQFTKCSYFIPDATISKGGLRGTTASDRLQVDMYLVKLPSDSYKIVSIQELASDGTVTNVITKRYKSNMAWVGSTCSISVGDKFADNTKCPTSSKAPELYEASVSSVAYTYSTTSSMVKLGGSLSSVFYPVLLLGGTIADNQTGVSLSLDGTSSPSQVMFGDNYKVNNVFSAGGRLPGRSVEFTVSIKGALSYLFVHPTPDASIVINNLGATLVVKDKTAGSMSPAITLSSLSGSSVKGRIDVSESAITISFGDKKAVFSTNTPKTTGTTLFLGAAGVGTLVVSNVTVL